MYTKRPLSELIELRDPAWPTVTEWFRTAKNRVDVLPVEARSAEEVLLAIQVTTRSPLGAIAYESGGVLFDGGWVRLLGSGHASMRGDLAAWNGFGTAPITEGIPGAFIVAHDVLGGVFAINSGAFDGAERNIFYFAPDALDWEDLERGYTDFVLFLCDAELGEFYKGYRWPGWKEDVARLSGDDGFSIMPPLWTKEGKDLATQSRRAVPMRELWGVQMEFRRQLGVG